MRDTAGARHLVEVVAVEQFVGGGPESFAAAELDRRHGDVQRVDEIGIQELSDRRDTTAEAYVFALCRILRLSQCFGGRYVEEVERRVGERERRSARGA